MLGNKRIFHVCQMCRHFFSFAIILCRVPGKNSEGNRTDIRISYMDILISVYLPVFLAIQYSDTIGTRKRSLSLVVDWFRIKK